MLLIEKYVFSEWLKAFLLTLLFLCGLTLLQDMADNFGDFRKFGVPAERIAQYYLYLLPGYLPWLLPVSLFISILLALGGMARRNEILAMRSSGISLPRASRLVLFASIGLAACVYGLNARWAPWSIEKTRSLRESFLHSDQQKAGLSEAEVGSVRNVRFDNRRAHRLWYINSFSEVTQVAHDLQVFVRDPDGVELYRISATRAWRDPDVGAWHFRNGHYVNFRTNSGTPRYSEADGRMIFDSSVPEVNSTESGDLPNMPQSVVKFDSMALRDFDEKPEWFSLLHKKPKDLSLRELNETLRAFPPEESAVAWPHAIRRREVLLAPLGCFLGAMIAIPFAVAGSGHRRGAGLARGLVLAVAYYLVLTFSNSLGEAGVVGADLAGSLPSLAMVLLAGFLLWRSR